MSVRDSMSTWSVKDRVALRCTDCTEALGDMPAGSVDAVVCDPPYGLEFMGKGWDKLGATTETAVEGADVSHPFRDGTRRVRYGKGASSMQTWHQEWAIAALRVLKPGGYLLAFGGTRTYHRLACAVEDAGFDIRDMIAWVYGSGFPKSLDVSKAIDKTMGAEHLREFKCKNPADRPYTHTKGETSTGWQSPVRPNKTKPATDAAKRWDGWGTALKPALEPIVVARKPLGERTVAANVMRHDTGGINVGACRVPSVPRTTHRDGNKIGNRQGKTSYGIGSEGYNYAGAKGRWPANLIHDGSPEVVGLFPLTAASKSGGKAGWQKGGYVGGKYEPIARTGYDEVAGSAARFFYCAKASKAERGRDNNHPTVKPLALMRYLVRLITPPQGLVLDPFMGSGTTGIACVREGFRFAGVEREAEYYAIAMARIKEAL